MLRTMKEKVIFLFYVIILMRKLAGVRRQERHPLTILFIQDVLLSSLIIMSKRENKADATLYRLLFRCSECTFRLV